LTVADLGLLQSRGLALAAAKEFGAEAEAPTARYCGWLCFYNEKVDLYLDELLQERPVSPFSAR
jgi:hypothetical protein